MYSIKKVLTFLVVMFVCALANAQFLSLHQSPQSYIDGRGISVSYTGFRNQFEPAGTPGCVMGMTSLRSSCTYVSGGLSFSLSGGQNSTQFKVYVPVGTTSFIFSSYLPQGMQAAVAVRMGSAPTRINPLNGTEYANYQAARNLTTVYQRLSAGEEVIMVADGGGSFSLAGNNRFSSPLAQGAWLYFRLINGDYIDTPRATYEIDLPSYIAGYNAITQANGWGGDGDPLEGGSVATPPTISFSIALSNTTLTQGVTSTVAITPNGGTLSSCSASSVVSAPTYSNNSITLTPSSAATAVTVTCTSTTGATAAAALTVKAATATTTSFSSFTLSPSSLLKTDTSTLITVVPNMGAVVPASTICQVMQSQKYLVSVGTNQWKISPDANVQQVAQSLTIDCGNDSSGKAITGIFSILEPLTITRNSTDLSQLTDLTFKFVPTLPTGITTADLYIFVYVPSIPISAFNKTTTLYGYQVKDGRVRDSSGNWMSVQNQLLPILFSPPDVYQKSVSSGTSFTVNLGYGVKGDIATAVKAEYYVAYLPTGTTDLTKLQFIGDKQGSFSGIPVFWKF